MALGAVFALYGATGAPEAKRWWSHILYLADDKLEGRETGSEGHRRGVLSDSPGPAAFSNFGQRLALTAPSANDSDSHQERNYVQHTATTLVSAAAVLGKKIRSKTARVGVIGLGYVGLPLAMEFARAG